MLLEQSPERVARVMAPKVAGASHLDALTRDADLDFFILFSSVASTIVPAGQGGYAAANACLDALAACRRAVGLCGQSLAWGPWADLGLARALDARQQTRLARQGVSMLSDRRAGQLFEVALVRPEANLVLVELDLKTVAREFEGAVPSLWRALVRPPGRAMSAGQRGGWSAELASLTEKDRLAAVLAVVRFEVARVLSLAGGDAVTGERPLKELGLDSLMAVELRNALGRRAGTTLPATLVFDHPTPAAIAQYLIRKMSRSDASIVVTPTTARPVEQDSLRKRLSEIDQFSSAELERELTESIQRVREEIGQ
jgi:acyl carrier protein